MGRAHEVRAASMAKTAAAKSKLNNKWSRIIYMAAKAGVPDPELNQNLKKEIEKAKREQVTADVIKRAIEKAKGANQENYDPLTLEGFGPGNSMFIVECLTDNHNRTQTAVKVALQKCGGKIAGSGSVAHMFKNVALFSIDFMTEEEALETLLLADCEVEDIESEDGIVTITAPNTEYGKIREALKEVLPEGKEFLEDTVCWLPLNEVELASDKELEQMERLLSLLEEDEDVQDVYHNVTGLPLGDE
jgi:YebC/PmpR family DNA-binding regulatory protein